MVSPHLSIVFPAYNEGVRIAQSLQQTVRFIDERGLDAEIVVVNDGSRDDTVEKARGLAETEPRLRVLSHSPNQGKGFTVREGMLEARGRYRVFLDVDMATPLETIDAVLPVLEAGADMVIGSRHLPDANIEVHQGFIRRSMGGVFRKIAHAMLGLDVTDITCGFKGMNARTAQALFCVQQETGWAFDAELIYVARKWGLDLREIPVTWRDSGDTRVQPLKAAVDSFQELRRIRQHDRRGAYARPEPGDDA